MRDIFFNILFFYLLKMLLKFAGEVDGEVASDCAVELRDMLRLELSLAFPSHTLSALNFSPPTSSNLYSQAAFV